MNPTYQRARFRSACPPDEVPDEFWIVTANNPGGVTLAAEENATRGESLRVQLLEHGLKFFPVTGYDPDSPHEEPGFGIVCDEATALAFGRQWEQEAIVKVAHGEVTVISCIDPGDRCELGLWISRADVS